VLPDSGSFRKLGLPGRRAACCATILARSDEVRREIERGSSWDAALDGIPGVGPWTRSVFKIMVLREPDVLPMGDVGLQRAIASVYGTTDYVSEITERWKPFRSVACWYLWRTLGNAQLG
jgi:3-methyladenine DNA glycosylase/8-oxoguanine DNA glycosylase